MSKGTKVVVALLALLGLAACSDNKPPPPGTSGNPVSQASSSSSSSATESSGAANSLQVVAAEPAANRFVFDTAGVESVGAGSVEITFRNAGTMTHELRVVKINDGDFASYQAAVASGGAAGAASLGQEVLAIPAVAAGSSATATAVLAPGTYALVSFLLASDNTSFAQHGMIARLEVTAAVTTEVPTTSPGSGSSPPASQSG